MTTKSSSNIVNATIGLVLIGLGALFLVDQFVNINFGRLIWPFFVIIPGLLLFAGMVLGGRSAGALAIPASIVTMIGLIFLYQNSFNNFETWSYAWALIPTAVGIGMMIQGKWSGSEGVYRNGIGTARTGLTLFLIFGVLFELVFNVSGRRGLGGYLFPVLIIAVGVFLILRRGGGTPERPPAVAAKPAKPVADVPPVPPEAEESPEAAPPDPDQSA